MPNKTNIVEPKKNKRLFLILFSLFFLAAITIGVLWARKINFNIKQVNITAELTQAQSSVVKKIILNEKQLTFFSKRISKLQNSLSAQPWIYTASVRRSYPDT